MNDTQTTQTRETRETREILMTLDDLRRILSESAGSDEGQLDGDILDTGFAELGYDSLALIETVSVVQRDYGVEIPDKLATPRELLDAVNGLLVAVG
ncbi:acyl carrier protein [Streptomyces sp. NPDC090445]|uniref:acyl carrier protein n=1 Tax=Streptomyces sp. NPDC090445 TaxID=3365963 RepID=UPI00382BCFC5